MRISSTLIAGLLAAGLAAPATALAGEDLGRGENITHVANVPFPNLVEPTVKNAGTDIEFATIAGRQYAFAGSYGDGLQIIDITDPSQPAIAATYDCGVTQGDVQVFQRPDLDNRWFVAYAMDTGYTFVRNTQCARDFGLTGAKPAFGSFIVEVTDPLEPESVSFIPVAQGAHNNTVHPSGKFLYNSNSDLITSLQPAVEVTDITDPAAPKPAGEVPLTTFPGLGTEAHDITFSQDGKRAYVAALSHMEILNTEDPAKPAVVGKLVDPAINVWHQTDPVTIKDPIAGERRFVLAEDEVAGATGTGQCPNGGVHVYDVTGPLEAAPVKVGYWNIADAGLTADNSVGVENGGGTNPRAQARLGRCTAHVFQLHEQAKLMTIAYYNGGVRVVDLSGLVGVALGKGGVGMKQLGYYRFRNSDTWAVKTPAASRDGFFLYGNDQSRAFDVYRYTRPAGTTSARFAGTWMTAEQQLAAARAARRSGGRPVLSAVCLLGKRGAERAQLRVAARRAGLALAR